MVHIFSAASIHNSIDEENESSPSSSSIKFIVGGGHKTAFCKSMEDKELSDYPNHVTTLTGDQSIADTSHSWTLPTPATDNPTICSNLRFIALLIITSLPSLLHWFQSQIFNWFNNQRSIHPSIISPADNLEHNLLDIECGVSSKSSTIPQPSSNNTHFPSLFAKWNIPLRRCNILLIIWIKIRLSYLLITYLLTDRHSYTIILLSTLFLLIHTILFIIMSLYYMKRINISCQTIDTLIGMLLTCCICIELIMISYRNTSLSYIDLFEVIVYTLFTPCLLQIVCIHITSCIMYLLSGLVLLCTGISVVLYQGTNNAMILCIITVILMSLMITIHNITQKRTLLLHYQNEMKTLQREKQELLQALQLKTKEITTQRYILANTAHDMKTVSIPHVYIPSTTSYLQCCFL